MKNSERIGVRLPDDLRQQIHAQAAQSGQSISDVVRHLVRQGLAQNQQNRISNQSKGSQNTY